MRCALVLAILLTGCSDASKSSRSGRKDSAHSTFVTKWKPEPEPEPKPPPPAPVVVPRPPDPAAEQRRAEAARREDEVRRRREKEKEFTGLPPVTQRKIMFVADALAAKGLDQLTNADLVIIKRFVQQFPKVNLAELDEALAVYGDRKGALNFLANLGITDPATSLRVRAAFGFASDPTCADALAAAAEIAKVGQSRISDRARSIVAGHPDIFPIQPKRP